MSFQAFLNANNINPSDAMPDDDSAATPEIDNAAGADLGTETATEIEDTSADQGADQGADTEDIFAPTFDPKTLPAELQPAYKSMQADYTRKTQAIAAERAALIADPVVQAAQQVGQLAQSDPVGLVTYLLQQVDAAKQHAAARGFNVDGLLQQQQAQDPLAGLDPEMMSDSERAMFTMMQQMRGVMQQMQQAAVQPQQQAQQQQVGEARLAALTQHVEANILKRALQPAEKQDLFAKAAQAGVRDANGFVNFVKAWDYDNAMQRGRNQAASVVPAKRQMAAGGNRAVRPAGGGNGGGAPAKRGIAGLVDLAFAGKLD